MHLTILVGAVLVNVIIGCAFAWFSWITHRQSLLRSQLIHELAETNNGLEASLAENTGLHRQLLAQAREAGMGSGTGATPTAGQKGLRPSGRTLEMGTRPGPVKETVAGFQAGFVDLLRGHCH